MSEVGFAVVGHHGLARAWKPCGAGTSPVLPWQNPWELLEIGRPSESFDP